MNTSSKSPRGAALIELALVLPILALLCLAPLLVLEIFLEKTRLTGIVRESLWVWQGRFEPTAEAARETALEQVERPRAFSAMRYGHVARGPLQTTRQRVPLARGVGKRFENAGLSEFGRVTVTARAQWMPSALAARFAHARGPLRLIARPLSGGWTERASAFLDDWHLSEGRNADVDRVSKKTGMLEGRSEHPLKTRVRALALDGNPASLEMDVARLRRLPLLDAQRFPALDGTFVVSRAYTKRAPRGGAAGCRGIPSYRVAAGSESGLRDFRAGASPLLDHDVPRCFDTSPMRDAHGYPQEGRPGNASLRGFQARGPFFLGCAQPMASDPSARAVPWYGADRGFFPCEGDIR
ncbi:MAG: hypothetical protein ACKVPX_15940 [Myxococcaceae bacterium]